MLVFRKILRTYLINNTLQNLYPHNFFSFQLFHADERFSVFALRASVLELISFMRLDG